MMVLLYCKNGNLRDYYIKVSDNFYTKIQYLFNIARGLLDIHNAGKVHKDFHSGNILCAGSPLISDLGMCQPASNEKQPDEGTFGVLSYMVPEVLRGYSYTKASDIYSFGIMMNEFMSEEIPYRNIPHDHSLAIRICKGLRPNISKCTPKLLLDLITKCWDGKPENRPTAKELFQTSDKWSNEYEDSEISSQIKEYSENKVKNKSNETHPGAIYTSRLLNFKSLQEEVHSPDDTNISIYFR
jgi:serine/threonine protein kinase